MPNVLSPRNLVSRPDNRDEAVQHTHTQLIEWIVLLIDTEHFIYIYGINVL